MPSPTISVATPAAPMPSPSATIPKIALPAPPQITPLHDPAHPPQGPDVSPDGPGGLYELPGRPGQFSYRGVSFRYPASWEMVNTNGYNGLIGNNLWVLPLGVNAVDRVLIMANYFPWEYSPRQMRITAQEFTDYQVDAQGVEILRRATRVDTAGVSVFWSDVRGPEATGIEVTSRLFLFAWNDIEYLFACQEKVGSDAGIIRGCDRIFSTLRLGDAR